MAESPLDGVTLHLVDSLDEALALKRWLGERRETPLGVDTETEGLSPYHDDLRLVQVGDLHTGWAIPWPLWGGLAQEVINSYEGDFVAHNASFDWRFLAVRGNIRIPWHRLHDTMTLAALDNPVRPRGLKELAARLVDRGATAGERALHDGMRQQKWTWKTVPYDFAPYWVYGALDPVLTVHLYQHLHPRVAADCPGVYDLERGVTRICANMMMHGMKLDKPYIEDAISRLSAFSQETRHWLRAMHGISSPLAPRQIANAFARLGCPVQAYTPTGQPKFDKETLGAIKDSSPDTATAQLASYILGVRHAEKIIGSYLEGFLELADSEGLIHCQIHPLMARTGRMSITDPALQTLHRDDKMVRGSFVPHEGNVFVSCDADQIEARMAAHFSADPGLIAAFHDADRPGGLDFFSGVATQLFGETIRKGDHRRQLTKNMTYCVPLSTQILTKRGWLSHEEVRPGDETIGYDIASGRSCWTVIEAVHHPGVMPLVAFGNSHMSFAVTPDHRWVCRESSGQVTLSPSTGIGPDDRVIIAVDSGNELAAPARILETLPDEEVFCVTTGLGSWTMRQNGQVTLTGNCYVYGGGLEKMAKTAGVTIEQMRPIRDAYLNRFPGLRTLARSTEAEAKSAAAATGEAAIRTPFGRRLPAADDRIYTALNYKIQGHAAEILKKGLLDLDAAGLGDYMRLPVHDEILLEVPAGQAEDIAKLVEDTLTDRESYHVPITWSASIMEKRWAKE